MRELRDLEFEYKYERHMESQHGTEANRLEKCVQCVKSKAYKVCPANCAYLER